MQKLISKIGVVTRGGEHQILAQLIQVLHLVAVGAICVYLVVAILLLLVKCLQLALGH